MTAAWMLLVDHDFQSTRSVYCMVPRVSMVASYCPCKHVMKPSSHHHLGITVITHSGDSPCSLVERFGTQHEGREAGDDRWQ